MIIRIEAERKRCGYSQEALSREIGITSRTYRNYIAGTPIPSDKLIRMADVLKCSTDYLLGLTERQDRP